MRTTRLLVALALAAALHAGVAAVLPVALRFFDPFLIAVLFISLGQERAWSLTAGCVLGLAHDALSGSLYGLHGFADTLVGFATATARQRLVIQGPLQMALLFAVAAALQQATLAAVQFLVVAGGDLPVPADGVGTLVVTGVVGTAGHALARRASGWEKGWREQRRRRLSIETR